MFNTLRLMNGVLLCYSLSTLYVEAAPKTVSDHKINFGWPNFFKPEMSMMREKGAKKGDSGREAEQGNEVDTSQEKDDYEALVDYTLKGGLRGTLLLLNSTTMGDVGNLTDSEVVNLTEAAAKVMQEEDKQEAGGSEVTAEGVRLRMPLVRKKHTPELGKYGAKVTFYASEEPTKFIYYGNWCGKGGRSAPVDNLDRCCMDHDKCYGRLVRQCPDVWGKPYGRMYAWTLLEQETVCVRSESFCVNHVCDCDRQAAKCFNHYLSTPSEIATHLGTKTS